MAKPNGPGSGRRSAGELNVGSPRRKPRQRDAAKPNGPGLRPGPPIGPPRNRGNRANRRRSEVSRRIPEPPRNRRSSARPDVRRTVAESRHGSGRGRGRGGMTPPFSRVDARSQRAVPAVPEVRAECSGMRFPAAGGDFDRDRRNRGRVRRLCPERPRPRPGVSPADQSAAGDKSREPEAQARGVGRPPRLPGNCTTGRHHFPCKASRLRVPRQPDGASWGRSARSSRGSSACDSGGRRFVQFPVALRAHSATPC